MKFHQLQAQYQPEVVLLLNQLPATSMDSGTIHNTPLYLPSSLPRDVLSKSSKRLVSMEMDLWIGQCRDSLAQLCTKLSAHARCQGRPRWLVLGRMSVRSGRQLSCRQGSETMGLLQPLTEVTLYHSESSIRVEGGGRGRRNTRRDRAEKSGSQGSRFQRLD